MSYFSFSTDLADLLVPLGIVGTVIAIITAMIAGVAFATGNADTGGIATAGWLVGVMLSLAASFAQNWAPLLVATAAFPLVIATALLVRLIVVRAAPRPAYARVGAATSVQAVDALGLDL